VKDLKPASYLRFFAALRMTKGIINMLIELDMKE